MMVDEPLYTCSRDDVYILWWVYLCNLLVFANWHKVMCITGNVKKGWTLHGQRGNVWHSNM